MKSRKKLGILSGLFLMCAVIPAAAQTTVSGHVYDSKGEPLIGAYVTVEGTSTGSITDIDGAYTISARPSDILKAEFMGFLPLSEKVGER